MDEETLAFAGLVGGVLIVVVVYLFLVPVVASVFNSTAMGRIPERYRKLPAGTAWLAVIPCVGWIWLIIYNITLSASLRAYFDDQGEECGDCGLIVAIIHAFFSVLSLISLLFGLVALIPLAVFLVTVSRKSNRIFMQRTSTFD